MALYAIKAHEIASVKILRIENELHAMNNAVFKKCVYELSGLNPSKFICDHKKIEEKNKKKESKPNILKVRQTPTVNSFF